MFWAKAPLTLGSVVIASAFLRRAAALCRSLLPGTSVLHTQLRHILFVPWLYPDAEAKRQRMALIVRQST